LQFTYWEPAIQGNLRAADYVLKVIDRRAKILGIDAPQKIQAEVVTYDGTGSLDAEVERIARIIDAAERETADATIIEQHSEGQPLPMEEPPSAPEQLPPEGDWNIWLYMAGRGAGKTRTAAEWLAWEAIENLIQDGPLLPLHSQMLEIPAQKVSQVCLQC
jgi:hypothetical protein